MKKITFIIAVMMYAITSCGTSIVKEANDYSGKTDNTRLSRTLKLTGFSGSGDFSIENSGCSELKAKTIKARNVNIRNSGVGKLYTEVIEGAAMHMKQSGHITAKLAFKGDGMEISNSGAGNMSIGVDCSSLMITNSGAASHKVSGTADDVKISGTGVANVDSSGLNKF